MSTSERIVASVKVKPVDVLGSWVTVTCLVIALGFAAVTRSWSPLVFFAGFLLVVNIVQASASTLLAVRAGRQSWDAFTSVHVVVAASAVAFLLAGAAALGERVIWFNADSIPSMLVAKDYGDRYSANKHRMFKLACETRGGGPMFLRDIDGRMYARCGEWYPQVYTVAATVAAFQKAQAETADDKPGMPFVIERDDE